MTVKAQDTTTYILTQFSDEDDGDDLLFKSKHGKMVPEEEGCLDDRKKGILFTVIGSFFSASASVSIKLAEEVVPVFQVLWFKFIVMFCLVGPMVLLRGISLDTDGRMLVLFVRSLAENIAMSFVLIAVMYLPIGEATVLMFFSMALFMVLMAALFLKEPLTCKVYLALVFGLLGVFLLADPEEIIYDHTFSKEKLYGLGAGIGHGLFRATSSIIVRKVGAKVDASVVIFYHSLYGLLIFTSIILLGHGWGYFTNDYAISDCFFIVINDTSLLAICISIGVLMFSCQSFATKGTQICDSATVATVRNVSIVFSFVFQVLVFNEIPSVYAGVGTVLIGIAIGLIISDK